MTEVFVGRDEDLALGQMKSVKVGIKNVVVFRDDQGELSALEDRCSHADVKLSVGKFSDGVVQCAAHGARFDVKSGRHLCMPAVSSVRKYEVKIVDGNIVVVVP